LVLVAELRQIMDSKPLTHFPLTEQRRPLVWAVTAVKHLITGI